MERGDFPVCGSCEKALPYAGGSERRKSGSFFSTCVFPLFYENEVRKALIRYKFGGAAGYAAVFSRFMAECIEQEYSSDFDVVTWIPVSRLRLLKRGYDQAELLAENVAGLLGKPCVRMLVKKKNVKPQSRLKNVYMRRANVSGAFGTVDSQDADGKRILVIDDIVTTGATLSECARLLLMKGAAEIRCAAAAGRRERFSQKEFDDRNRIK